MQVVSALDIKKCFGDVDAVRGVDLQVSSGESVGIVGANGAGKTTTLLMLLGAISPDSGTVRLFGEDMETHRSHAMNSVGFAAGYLPLPKRLTVREMLRFFASLYQLADVDNSVDEVIDELSIGPFATRRCESLSSGQQTLSGIAKAVVHRPRLLILDEPTASLDPDVAFRLRERLSAYNADHNMSLLLTSHDMGEVEQLSQRVLFMARGRVIANGSAAEITAAGGHGSLHEMFIAEAKNASLEEFR